MPRDARPSFLSRILTTIVAVVGVAAVTGRTPRRAGERISISGDAAEDQGPATRQFPEGWGKPQPDKLAHPTYWPVVLALGIAFIFWGPVTTLFISGVGLVLFAIALAGWIGELRHE